MHCLQHARAVLLSRGQSLQTPLSANRRSRVNLLQSEVGRSYSLGFARWLRGILGIEVGAIICAQKSFCGSAAQLRSFNCEEVLFFSTQLSTRVGRACSRRRPLDPAAVLLGLFFSMHALLIISPLPASKSFSGSGPVHVRS